MKTKNTTTENKKAIEKVINYASELLKNGASVGALAKYGYEFREIRSGNEYVCLCMADFEKALTLAFPEKIEIADECTTVCHHTTVQKINHICKTIAEAVAVFSGSSLPSFDMAFDLNRFEMWRNFGVSDIVSPSAPFFFAVRRQGSESGTREHVKSRCSSLGSPVYVMKVEREKCGLFTLKVRVSGKKTGEDVTAAWLNK